MDNNFDWALTVSLTEEDIRNFLNDRVKPGECEMCHVSPPQWSVDTMMNMETNHGHKDIHVNLLKTYPSPKLGDFELLNASMQHPVYFVICDNCGLTRIMSLKAVADWKKG